MSAIDSAGSFLASWAHREALLRAQARSPEPLHVQYGGGGNIIAQPDGREVLFLDGGQQLDGPERVLDG